jgi:hypothetical protein
MRHGVNSGKKIVQHNCNLPVADISKMSSIPDSVQDVLKNACYGFHSNDINYPWYSYIQPIGWLMAKHIKQGKEDLNFSEFGNYSVIRRQRFGKTLNNEKNIINSLWFSAVFFCLFTASNLHLQHAPGNTC